MRQKFFVALVIGLGANAAYLGYMRLKAPTPFPDAPHPSGVNIGDIRVLPLHSAGEGPQKPLSIKAVANGQCAVLALFRTTCPGCDTLAVYWRGITKVGANGRTARVIWVAESRSDSAAVPFLHENGLGDTGYALPNADTRRELRVSRVPLLYLISPSGRIVKSSSFFPNEFDSLPPECE